MAGYDNIAIVYDSLSRIVFGNALVRAQVCLLPFIPAGSRMLIAGGGTGWILEHIAAIHPQGLMIDYVESSGRMLTLARQRDFGGNKVNFIHCPIQQHISPDVYDVIMTPFLLDNFDQQKANFILRHLHQQLSHGGLWLYTDFIRDSQSPLWQRLLLRIMYLFFRIVSHIAASELPEVDSFFAPGYEQAFFTTHCAGFISSVAYCKK